MQVVRFVQDSAFHIFHVMVGLHEIDKGNSVRSLTSIQGMWTAKNVQKFNEFFHNGLANAARVLVSGVALICLLVSIDE